MLLYQILLLLGFGAYHVDAFAVFAHFMVGNTREYVIGDWQKDMHEARLAGIDAFALNMANGEKTNDNLAMAFSVAENLGYKLFFSFDYAGNGVWNSSTVIGLINKYNGSSAYYRRNYQPLVSTFEGPGMAGDWHEIKSKTGCFFVPDYSSLGAKEALKVGSGVADGLFSWAAWPAGPTDMNTYGDASYMQFIASAGKKTYMMPVSPWFYTNLRGYDKNWLWRGDDLWYDRWVQVQYLTRIQKDFTPPEFAQIISWNDFGESHYIGPIINKATYALDSDHGKAPFNYANNVGHGGFRKFLAFTIQLAKTGTATVGTQGVRMWYRNSAVSACGYAMTVANTATQLQLEYTPAAVVQDKIFYSALLGAAATVTVTVGGVSLNAKWTDIPPTGVGIYHGSASFAGRTGQVVVTVSGIATVTGDVPIGGCTTQNFNPYSYGGDGPSSSASVSINNHVCVEGFGIGGMESVCGFACKYGYCPVTACTCTKIGPQPSRPTALQKDGYPTDGNHDFDGLCSFSINYGYTGKECSTKKPASYFTPTKSPFVPDTSTGGSGLMTSYDGMCKFSCRYGWCPINLCKVTSTGTLVSLPNAAPKIAEFRSTLSLDEFLLCRFTSIYGQQNTELCFKPGPSPSAIVPVVPPSSPAPPPPTSTAPSEPVPTTVWRVWLGTSISGLGQPAADVLFLSRDGDLKCNVGYPLQTSFMLYNAYDDVSSSGGWACDGCLTTDAGNWLITRLEMKDDSMEEEGGFGRLTVDGGLGYITAYRGNDGTYALVSTTKIGQPQKYQGHCIRAPPDADDFQCPGMWFGTGAKHVLTCTSFFEIRIDEDLWWGDAIPFPPNPTPHW